MCTTLVNILKIKILSFKIGKSEAGWVRIIINKDIYTHDSLENYNI